ncbi:helix-turn-helix domain-containing protein [Lacticaseibacillus baoqingensis]|uniref:Helix-turn-helix domain-containing protein n=1 Tax=Lacticaseibacillus baoqingensis TaxID=2486013 RepID=A0ABW4E5T5_9LACO|nr:helix-turn-helix transcriptional regulator [Lacticaseibacillus baoqingensis]
MSIGDNIRQLRKSRGYNQEKFAKIIGVSRPYLSELEHDKRNLGTATLRNLAKKMNVSMLYLMEGSQYDTSELPPETAKQLSELESQWFDDGQKGAEQRVVEFVRDPDYKDTPFRFETLTAMSSLVEYAYRNKEPGLTDHTKKLRAMANLLDNVNKMLADPAMRTEESLQETKNFIDLITTPASEITSD